jgi:2-dehydropantoate 2-reductase
MRVGVIGAGAIGGTIAALLADAGHDVCVTARGGHARAIREDGLTVDGAWGEHHADLPCPPRLPADRELVFICTKAHDAQAALEAEKAALRNATVVVVQNGLTGVTEAARTLPGTQVVGALALFAAAMSAPGRITVTAPGDFWLGSGSGAAPPAARMAAGVLGAVLPTHVVDNFTGCQWTKLVVNQVNAMPAITGLSVQDTIRHPGLRLIVARSMREAVRLALATGVRFGRLQGLGGGILRAVASCPPGVASLLLRAMARRMGPVPNLGSTLQSIRRGRPSEIDYLNGAVADWARSHARVAPVNDELVRLVHEVEATGRFMGADDVVARFSR